MGKKITVMGMDPSLNNFGLVHATVDLDTNEVEIVNLSLVQPPEADKATKKAVRKNSDDLRRARSLQSGMTEALTRSGASIAIVEVPVGSQSARAMASYGICVGVLASCPVPIIEVSPTEVKLTATGSKTASKEQMIRWAMDRHPNANWKMRKSKGELVPTNDNEHLADALAAIYAGMRTEQFKQAVAMFRALG